MSQLDKTDKDQTDIDESISVGKKIVNSARGTLSQRFSLALTGLFLAFICLLSIAFIQFLWKNIVHFLS